LLPLAKGMGAIYHPNPLDARTWCAKRLQPRNHSPGNTTFLQNHTRRCNPEDFGSLQFVMVGAEKLTDRVAAAFEEKFGIRRWKVTVVLSARPLFLERATSVPPGSIKSGRSEGASVIHCLESVFALSIRKLSTLACGVGGSF
jgi:hypothetical protein